MKRQTDNVLDVTGVLDNNNQVNRKVIDPALSGNDETNLQLVLEQHNANHDLIQAGGDSNSNQPVQDNLMLSFSFGSNSQHGDPKRTCSFCGRTFSHAGSLGRHLDLKRGTRLHPASQVDRLRHDVKRRGDPVEVKQRRSERARLYNAREDVKNRAKLRRKEKEQIDAARDTARTNFFQKLGFPSFPGESSKYHSSFAYFTLFFLPSTLWPYGDGLPSEESYNQICNFLSTTIEPLDPESANLYRSKLDISYQEWTKISEEEKYSLWTISLKKILESTLGTLSAYNISTRDAWLAMEQDRILNMKEDGDGSVGDSDLPVDSNVTGDVTNSSYASTTSQTLEEPQNIVAFANAAVSSASPI